VRIEQHVTEAEQQHQQRVEYFNSRYWKIADQWFRTEARAEIRDHTHEEDRRCRFCGLGKPAVKFKKLAHAVADFLGNTSVISLNECDDCNTRFGSGCEDHLAKATLLHRAVAGVPRKDRSRTTFKDRPRNETLRVESNNHVLSLHVAEPRSAGELLVAGQLPDEIPLLGDTSSQPYSPIQATMALVKFACSICPHEELSQCQGAIDWISGRLQARVSHFPISFAHTPGTFDERVSHALLLRRKDDGPEPHLWFFVQFRNFRLGVPVPFCAADRGVLGPRFEHYPSMFPPSWPLGATQFSWLDWAAAENVRTPWTVSFRPQPPI
jgi:hypothetical protein